MPPFIPKRHKQWTPERSRGPIARRCHWCTGEKHRISKMLQVIEGPMRFHFCKEGCYDAWQQHRHTPHVVQWLRLAAGERHIILRNHK